MSDQNINGYQNEQTNLNDNDYFDIDAYLGIDDYESRKVKWVTIKNSLMNGVSNIYNSDGTLTNTRKIFLDGKRISFLNGQKITFQAQGDNYSEQFLEDNGLFRMLSICSNGSAQIDVNGDDVDNKKILVTCSGANAYNYGIHYVSDFSLNWDNTTDDTALTTKGYVDRAVQGQGNARAEFYHYSLQTSQDHQPFFDDGIIQIGWDSPGNDVEVTMLTEPSGTGDMVSYAKTGSSSVVSTYITQPNLTYDVFPAGLTALEALVVLISAEQDPTFPSYRMTFHNAGTSYNTVIEIKKITPN